MTLCSPSASSFQPLDQFGYSLTCSVLTLFRDHRGSPINFIFSPNGITKFRNSFNNAPTGYGLCKTGHGASKQPSEVWVAIRCFGHAAAMALPKKEVKIRQ